MKSETLKFLKLGLMMLCAIVGVGFVSGAEIYSFYVRFGDFAFLGVFVFFVLINILLNKILKQFDANEKSSKMDNFDKISSKNTLLAKSKIKSILINFNVLLVASAMLAGLFSLIKNLFNHNYLIVGIFAISLVFLVLYFGVKGLAKFDIFVVYLLAFVGVVFFKNMDSEASFALFCLDKFSVKQMVGAMIFAVLYVFMNVIQVQPIISEFQPKFSAKTRKLFVFIFSLALAFVLLLFVVFLKNNLSYSAYEMPFLAFFKGQNKVLFCVFVAGLFMALISSLLSCLIGVKNLLLQKVDSKFLATGGAILLAMILSLIGFSTFVEVVYPVIGVLNFIIFVFL